MKHKIKINFATTGAMLFSTRTVTFIKKHITMKQNILIIVAAMLIGSMQLSAKPVKRPESFNFQRGMEAYYAQKYGDALEYLEKELNDNPKNSYAYTMTAIIYNGAEEFGKALACANAAIKYAPKKDPEWVGLAYSIRADIYANIEDTTAALNDYAQAIKHAPEQYSYYAKRGDLYFELKQYDLSDADFRMMLNSDDSEEVRDGLMGLGRNLIRQGYAKEALDIYNRVIKLHNDDAIAYGWRAETYLELKKYNEATDDLITALMLNNDKKASYLMRHLKNEEAFAIMRLKLKKEQNNAPNSGRWYYYEGNLCDSHDRYREAIEAYKKAAQADASVSFDDDIADCYLKLGDYDNSIRYYKRALEADSTDNETKIDLITAYGRQGNFNTAINISTGLIEEHPDIAGLYFMRAWYEADAKLYDDAINDLSTAIMLDNTNAEFYSNRARCYMQTGQTDLARADFEKTLELSEANNENRCGALAWLGRKDETMECTRTLVDEDGEATDSVSYYYSAACIYSVLNEKQLALQCLERSMQLGFCRFAHIEADMDLDNIRGTHEFRTMVDKYRQQHRQSLQTAEHTSGSVSEEGRQTTSETEEKKVVEVPFSKANGVTKVDCTINNLPLNFVFDTGASDVTLSQVEANFMFKNNYLNDKDIAGEQHYQTADGNISVGTVVNLRKINFGGLELNNVRASVVKSQHAPLLLGQSVLQRLGKIEIDNEKQVLRISVK